MPRALLHYMAQARTADWHWRAQRDAPARTPSRARPPRLSPRPSRRRPPGRRGAPPAHRARRQPTTDIPRSRHATVHAIQQKGDALARALHANGYLGAAKPSQPDGIGQVCAAATKERSIPR
jgi:hypothetical protein